ncbi:MAG: glycosyltransferase [Gemmatimonadaceae bacterium]
MTSIVNVHVYPSPIRNEARMLRITETLAKNNVFDQIVLVGTASPDLPADQAIDDVRRIMRVEMPAGGNGLLAKVTRTRRWSRAVRDRLRHHSIACVNAHSLSVLPLCDQIRKSTGAALVYDTHELETETVHSTGIRRLGARVIERRLIPHADAVSVVNEPIADWYRRAYGLPDVTVVRNLPKRAPLSRPRSGELRQRVGVGDDALLFIYQGIFAVGRSIPIVLEAFKGPGRHHLLMIGYGQLDDLVTRAAAENPRIHVLEPVAPEALPAITAEADIGLALIEDICLSYRLCLPNKIFEYMNAGIPSVVSNRPAMTSVVRETGAGWILEDLTPRALAAFVAGLSEESLLAARASAAAHRDRFTWEQEEAALLSLYARLGFIPRATRTQRDPSVATSHVSSDLVIE